jgi:hypothetical protein
LLIRLMLISLVCALVVRYPGGREFHHSHPSGGILNFHLSSGQDFYRGS